jgi:tetratricopeptide (TPR) repeat protein
VTGALKTNPWACALVLLAAGCAQLNPQPDGTPKAAAPQITESMLRDRAHEQLATGIRQFEAGDFDNAMKSLSSSLDHGLLTKAEQATARKNLAFVHCVSNREAACRDEFRKAFEIYPEFSLAPNEDGHPIWGPVYRNVRTQLVMEREAAQQRGRPVIPLSRAEQLLADGLVKYSAGDYDGAIKTLDAALKEGLPEKADRVRAMKHIAFSLCLKDKYRECRAQFVKIYDVDPAFDLTPAEVGHPSWSRTFAAAKAQAKRNLAAKGKPGAPSSAAVPTKKN